MINVAPKLAKAGVSKANILRFAPHLNSMMDKAGINTEKRINAFLAQILHESGNLSQTKEGTKYTADRLLAIFPSYFKTKAAAQAAIDAGTKKLFDILYGGRMGNNKDGDGLKYIGRGIIGNTGKSQYEALKRKSGIDFVSQPELLEQPKYAVMAAIDYWHSKGLNKYADSGDFQAISKAVNTGSAKSKAKVIGKEDRDLKFRILSGLKVGADLAKKNPFSTIVLVIILFCIFAYAIKQLNKS